MYRIVFSEDAKKDLKELYLKAPMAVKKLSKLLKELQEHPRTGTGQVEPLKGYEMNCLFLCNHIDSLRHDTHRLLYSIYHLSKYTT